MSRRIRLYCHPSTRFTVNWFWSEQLFSFELLNVVVRSFVCRWPGKKVEEIVRETEIVNVIRIVEAVKRIVSVTGSVGGNAGTETEVAMMIEGIVHNKKSVLLNVLLIYLFETIFYL